MPTTLPRLLILFLLAPACFAAGPAMEGVRISPDHKRFVLHPSGRPYTPWGHNYGSVDILQRMSEDPARVERDFVEMKAAGTTVARIHPEMPRLLSRPEAVDPKAIDQLAQLLKI